MKKKLKAYLLDKEIDTEEAYEEVLSAIAAEAFGDPERPELVSVLHGIKEGYIEIEVREAKPEKSIYGKEYSAEEPRTLEEKVSELLEADASFVPKGVEPRAAAIDKLIIEVELCECGGELRYHGDRVAGVYRAYGTCRSCNVEFEF